VIRVFVEVHEEAAPRRVQVRAESISQAVRTIEDVHPGRTVQVVFPIDPEEFFLEDSQDAGAVHDRSRTLVHDSVGDSVPGTRQLPGPHAHRVRRVSGLIVEHRRKVYLTLLAEVFVTQVACKGSSSATF
jgi:hypothetical protein